jgi:acetyltransferase (GNAT) family protein
LALVLWSDEQTEAFLRQQFDAQDAHYRTYDNARSDVIEINGEPVGRLYVARWDDEIRIMDIALLPEHRGAGSERRRSATSSPRAPAKASASASTSRSTTQRCGSTSASFAPVADRGVYLLEAQRAD